MSYQEQLYRYLGKKFLQDIISSRDGPEKSRNKAGMKQREKTTVLWNDGGKERQEY